MSHNFQICQECGRCCVNTEMVLSLEDIERILRNNEKKLSIEEFAFKNEQDLLQLKNIDNRCFFYDNNQRICKIYRFRPKGCKFYPLIYDPLLEKCVFDSECPFPEYLYPESHLKLDTCKKIKEFIEGELTKFL